MNLENKTLLITGGTGTLGAAFSKYALENLRLKKLIIFSRDWLKQKKLRDKLDNENIRWFIGDIRDRQRLDRALNGVDIVIHAAAIKDLESCEYNTSEAMLTNVVGTQNVIDMCIQHKVQKSILISTDKAVNAINAYGTTKALAEKLWINANKYSATDNIKFQFCRYGNVFGSSGSVVPLFEKLVNEGVEKLPITDTRMTRFFLTIDRAVQIILDTIERDAIITVPTLPSMRVLDLAFAYEKQYEITGVRDGEKLHEELEIGYSSKNNTRFLTVNDLRRELTRYRNENR